MGTNVQEAVLKIAYGPLEAPQPVPPVVDSLKTQILEKLPDVGSDGSYTIGYTQSAVDFNEKSIGDDAKNSAPEIANLSSTAFRGRTARTKLRAKDAHNQ